MRKILVLLLLFGSADRIQAQLANRLPAADKVYGLSKFWQEVNYNFIYLNKVNAAGWDSLCRQMITVVQDTKTHYAYYRQFQKICAFLKDGCRFSIHFNHFATGWYFIFFTLHNEWGAKVLLSFLNSYHYNFDFAPDTISLKAKRLVVPTVLLLGHGTASSAEDFRSMPTNRAHMIKMRENSLGSTGQPYLFDLPGGGSSGVCTKKDTYPDGREFVGYCIKPDITVTPILSDYLQQKDPDWKKQSIILNRKCNDADLII